MAGSLYHRIEIPGAGRIVGAEEGKPGPGPPRVLATPSKKCARNELEFSLDGRWIARHVPGENGDRLELQAVGAVGK